jgi:transposase
LGGQEADMAHLFWPSDEAWEAMDPYLPRSRPGKPRGDDRRGISGILHVLKTGCRWRDVPPEYGPPTTIYNRSTAGPSAASGSACSRSWPPQARLQRN